MPGSDMRKLFIEFGYAVLDLWAQWWKETPPLSVHAEACLHTAYYSEMISVAKWMGGAFEKDPSEVDQISQAAKQLIVKSFGNFQK